MSMVEGPLTTSTISSATRVEGHVALGWQWPEPGTRWVLLKADVTKAHRRVKVLRRDGG